MPALMAACAAASLLVNAVTIPELSIQPSLKSCPITLAILELFAVTLIVAGAELLSAPEVPVTVGV